MESTNQRDLILANVSEMLVIDRSIRSSFNIQPILFTVESEGPEGKRSQDIYLSLCFSFSINRTRRAIPEILFFLDDLVLQGERVSVLFAYRQWKNA